MCLNREHEPKATRRLKIQNPEPCAWTHVILVGASKAMCQKTCSMVPSVDMYGLKFD